jgi:hypothetical protein
VSPVTLVGLALAGSRTDTVRVVMTAVSAVIATVVMLLAATVLAIPGLGDRNVGAYAWADQYRLQVLVEPELRPGVAIALVLLTIPVLALAAQCGRLGAPARDRRLAAIRLAGATPGQAVLVAAAETGVASGLGAGIGMVVYLVGRRLLHRPDPAGRLLLPTDVLPAAWALVAICAGLPLLATAVAAVLLRRTAFTPYGVVRRIRSRPPQPYVGLLIVVGVAILVGVQQAGWAPDTRRDVPEWVLPLVLFPAASAAVLGVVLGTGWISHTAGRLLHRVGRGPAALLAARRLIADPWAGSRTFAVLLACVLLGAGVAGMRARDTANFAIVADWSRWEAATRGLSYQPEDRSSYFDTQHLVNGAVAVAVALAAAAMLVAIAESIVSRRRAYAAMVATGVPRGVLARAVLLQTLVPVVPAVLLALAVGVTMPRSLGNQATFGGYDQTICTADWSQCQDAASPYRTVRYLPRFVQQVPVPLDDLALLGVGAVTAVLVVAGVGLLFLRSATALEELRTT